MLRLALYQPDIPQNLGMIMRLAACFGVSLQVIEPCGFPLDDRKIKMKSLDYGESVELVRHASWEAFEAARAEQGGRLVLATTKGAQSLYAVRFEAEDWLLFGRESAGVPDAVHDAADLRVRIPLQPGMRSLNIAMAAGIVLSEAVRQCGMPSAAPVQEP